MIVLFIVATTTTLGAFGAHRQWLLRQDLEQRFERTRAEALEGLRQSLAAPAWALNVGILRTRLESTLIHPEVIEACVFSPDLKEVYAAVHRATRPGKPSPCSAGDRHDVLADVMLYPPDDVDPERRKQAIGKAVIRFTREGMRATLRAALIQGVIEVAAIDVVLVVLLTFGLRMVFRPLEDLRGALFELASSQGDHLDELATLGRTEFDRVIDGFNLVLRRLRFIIAQRTEAEIAARAATRVSNQAFVQIQATQAELVEKNRLLEVLSKTDQLTGVFNRRHLDEVLSIALERNRRDGAVFSIILIDVDRFKSVNDTHGHPVGDRVLADMVGLMIDVKRPTDTIGRWGGEEFLLICSDSSLEDALRFAQRLRKAVEAHDFAVAEPMTASLGVASMQDGDTIHGMISRADKALYRSKALGRNRVEYAADTAAAIPDGDSGAC